MMISINLRPGTKRKASGGGKKFAAMFKDLTARVKDPLLAGVVAAWILVIGGLGFLWAKTSHELASASEQLATTSNEAKRFETLMREKHKAERIRDSLQTQISVIRGVDRGRYVWPHVLDEISKNLPPYTWLTDVSVIGAVPGAVVDSSAPSKMRFRIFGRTVDAQSLTQLYRQLEASPWFENVTLLRSETVVESQRPVTSFQFQADFGQADSAYIRTVPLAQSVR